jgi:hypothetical protein
MGSFLDILSPCKTSSKNVKIIKKKKKKQEDPKAFPPHSHEQTFKKIPFLHLLSIKTTTSV